MKIICENNSGFRHLTNGKEYEVAQEIGQFYQIVNDNNVLANYGKSRFTIIEEEQIKEEIIPTTSTTRQSNIEEIEILSERIEIRLINDSNEYNLYYSKVSSNCGVDGIYGINDLFEDIDLNEELFEEIIQAVINRFKEKEQSAMLVFSTNDDFEEIWHILDKFSSIQTDSKINPNSYNQIKLWIVYLN